jgi:PKD repeat protein
MIITPTFHRRRSLAAVILAGVLAGAGCSLEEQTPPGISGPSEFALSLTASVTSNVIQRDGSAQSTISITARNEVGAPAVGRRILISTNAPASTGISATEVVTDGSGRATVTVTAPPSGSVGDLISVGLTPVGADGLPTQVTQTVSVGLTPSNTGAPTAQFTFSPPSPGVNEQITFNATTSRDENATCGQACTYTWDFGDGTTGSGIIVTKSYSASGNRSVTLVVRDPAGVASLPATQVVPVAPPTAPNAGTIGVSPTPVRPGQTTNFDAGGAMVGAGATIVDYTWVWGDGTSPEITTSAQAQHTFATVGTYTVRTTVRDSLNRTATTTTAATVTTQ